MAEKPGKNNQKNSSRNDGQNQFRGARGFSPKNEHREERDQAGTKPQARRDSGSPYSGSPRGERKEDGGGASSASTKSSSKSSSKAPSSGPPGQGDYGVARDAQQGRNPTMGGQPYYRNQGLNFNEDLEDPHQDGDRHYDRDQGRK